ncbi:hypothetical protein BH09BAC1_BH09BAC1_00660 [soil metagenome]
MRYLMMFALAAVLLSGCDDPNRVFEVSKDLPNQVWNKDHMVDFEFDIEDTVQRYNIIVNVRHTNFYEKSNLWVMVYTTYPDATEQEQRLELSLADENGEWFGKCTGDICDIQQFIQQNVMFNQIGTYKLKFEQIMRMDDLKDVLAFGLRVEKVEEKKSAQ